MSTSSMVQGLHVRTNVRAGKLSVNGNQTLVRRGVRRNRSATT